jgi:lysine/ornithine N-monooxygenase
VPCRYRKSAKARGYRATLQLAGQEGRVLDLTTDHVIAATGYRFALRLLPFLSQNLKSRLRAEQELPVLSYHFESSVPGLYFTGLASAHCFGPAMRFLHGANYTARCLSRHIAAERRQHWLLPASQFGRALRSKEF